jgi:galactokinase
MRGRSVRFGEGFRLLIAPALPARRGLGTAAAISVAVVRAICAEANLPVDAPELVALCQDIGRLVVGIDPTAADHDTAARAESGHLMASVPPPAATDRLVPWPADLGLWGLDDGGAHAPHDPAFAATRVGVAMAFRLVAAAAGFPVERQGPGRVTIDDPRWRGCLANVPVDLFEEEFAPRLPESMAGADFLARFDGVADPRAAVDPHTHYPVRAAASLAVHERERAIEFESFLGMYPSPDRTAYLGELLRASHEDHVACGLVTEDTQAIVDLVSRRGGALGLVGAKVTSGGGGGVVAVLGEADARPGLDLVRRQLRSRHHALPAVYVGRHQSRSACRRCPTPACSDPIARRGR